MRANSIPSQDGHAHALRTDTDICRTSTMATAFFIGVRYIIRRASPKGYAGGSGPKSVDVLPIHSATRHQHRRRVDLN